MKNTIAKRIYIFSIIYILYIENFFIENKFYTKCGTKIKHHIINNKFSINCSIRSTGDGKLF